LIFNKVHEENIEVLSLKTTKNSQIKVAVTANAFSKNEFLRENLKSFFSNVKFNETGKRFSQKELIEFLKDADAAIVGLDKINEDVLKELLKLKIIAKYGVGLDNIDQVACQKYKVAIGWSGGVNKLSVAEMTLGFMLGLSRNLYKTSSQLSKGHWNKSGGVQLSGQTIGVIGVGHIGKEVIRLLKPFFCKILVNDIIDQEQYYKENGLHEVTKNDIFKNSDIITIHTPLTEETKYLINKDTMNVMKPTAYIINTARGGIVNQNDLKYALQNNIIAGAALDAYEVEPPEDMELLALDNFDCTPHIGGNSKEAVRAMGESAINHLRQYFDEEKQL